MYIRFATTIIFFVVASTTATPTYAETAGLSIDPTVVEILVSPNKKVIQAISVKNQGKSGQFFANIHQIMPNGTNGQVKVVNTPLDPTSIPLNITLQNAGRAFGKPFPIGEGESTELALGIEGATSDESEDVYFALVVTPEENESREISTQPAIAALVLVTLTSTGNLAVNLEVNDFDPPLIHDSLTELSLRPVLKNNSPSMIRPEGTLEIISPRGSTHQTIKLYPNLVLGNSSREMRGQDQASVSSGQGEVADIGWTPSLRNIGPYRLRLTITTLGGTKIQEIEKTVWLVPFKAVTLVVLLAISALILLKTRHRRIVLDSPLENE